MTSAEERPARLKVGVVGAGRVGAVLGAALRSAGHQVVAVSGVSDASRRRAAELLPGIPVVPVEEVVAQAELVLLAVPDDALTDLVAGLSATRAWQAGQLVVHTSGRHGLDVFAPALPFHVLGLAVHPAMTFTGTAMDIARLADCCFGVTAPEPLRPVAEALVLEVGGEPVWIEERHRALYHAALAHGANHLVTLIAQSMEALAAAGSPTRTGCWSRWPPRPWTTACARVTPLSPARSRGAMSVRLPSTCASSSRSPRTSGPPTWPSPGRRRSGRWRAGGCGRRRPNPCWTSLRAIRSDR